MDNKSDIRLKAKDIRKHLDIEKISKSVIEKIQNFDIYRHAMHVMLFYPMKYEINLLDLLNDDKKFYLPKVNGENLYVCPYKKGDKLVKSSFNVFEPCTNPVGADCLDLIFVPALTVDKNNFRLGYGGGFYDRFLKTCPNVCTVVPISNELIIEKLPRENHDIPIDYVISN